MKIENKMILLLCTILLSTSAHAGGKKYIGLGPKGVSKTFKNEVTVFEASEDPQPRCPGCKNYRVIVDLTNEGPVGSTAPSAVEFDTKEACGGAVTQSPMADLNPLYRHMGSPLMTRNHPLMLMLNPSLCKGDVITLNVLGRKCLNSTEIKCQELVVKKAYEIEITKFQKDLVDIDLEEDILPNMVKGTSRAPQSEPKPAVKK